MNIQEKISKYLNEGNAADEVKAVIKKAIAFYEKMDELDDKQKEVLSMLKDMSKLDSFSPKQAQAVYNISKGISKMTGK